MNQSRNSYEELAGFIVKYPVIKRHITRQKVIFAIEAGLLFLALPLAYYFHLIPIPKIPLLLLITAGCLIWLIVDKNFSFKTVFHFSEPKKNLGIIFLESLLLVPLLLGLTWLVAPESLYFVPMDNIQQWLFLMIIYPVFSALPQELLFRSFFFHRYRFLLKGTIPLMIASTLAFAFMHIVYFNWIAVLLTLVGGFFFSRTYIRTGSVIYASLQHGILGGLIFSLGLGRFFM